MLSILIKTTILSTILLVVIEGGIIQTNTHGIQEQNGVIFSYHDVKETVKELLDSFMPPRLTRYDCPWPYQLIADSCVYLSTFYGNWEKSREFCRSLNGDLANFRDGFKMDSILSYMNLAEKDSFWIGGSRPNSSYNFVWLDGSDLPDTSLPIWNYKNEDGLNCVSLTPSDTDTQTYKLENSNCIPGYGEKRNVLCSLL